MGSMDPSKMGRLIHPIHPWLVSVRALFNPCMLHVGQSSASFASPSAKALNRGDRFESVPWHRHMCSTDMLGPAIWCMQRQTSRLPWQMSGRSWRRGWICEMMFSKVLQQKSGHLANMDQDGSRVYRMF